MIFTEKELSALLTYKFNIYASRIDPQPHTHTHTTIGYCFNSIFPLEHFKPHIIALFMLEVAAIEWITTSFPISADIVIKTCLHWIYIWFLFDSITCIYIYIYMREYAVYLAMTSIWLFDFRCSANTKRFFVDGFYDVWMKSRAFTYFFFLFVLHAAVNDYLQQCRRSLNHIL